MLKTVRSRATTWMIPLLFLVTGCSQPDQRVIELSQQSCDRQAQQNQAISEQSRQVAETTQQFVKAGGEARKEMLALQRELVEAEAHARNELLQIQQGLVERDTQCRQELNTLQRESQATIQTERQSVDRQREDLENERRQIASERQRAPLVAAAITEVGLVLACLLPLLLCGYLLYVLRHAGDDDEAVTEVLVKELVAERPTFLLPAPPAATERPALPCGETEPDSDPDDTEPGRSP